jgi:membrane protein required for colicin V production
MAWVDIAILTVLALSILLSFFSGFVKEAISLASLIAAIWVALTYSDNVATYLPAYVDSMSFQVAGKDLEFKHLDIVLAAGLLVLGVLLAGSIISYIAGKLVQLAALSSADKMLGVAFGAFRGAVIVVMLIMVAGLTSFPQSRWWNESRLVGLFQQGAEWAIIKLPDKYAREFSYLGADDAEVIEPDVKDSATAAKATPDPETGSERFRDAKRSRSQKKQTPPQIQSLPRG